jgi:transcriptional regulator GlxA family with amidase domain
MLIDGRWRPHREGWVSLAPAHVLHAFHAIPSKRWRYCWVGYTPASPRSMVHAMAPIIGRFDRQPLGHAIMGLFHEMQMRRDMAACALWLDLVESYVESFTEPWRREERLVAVWSAVRRELSRPWTLADLAGLAGLSGEHLRRLCHSSLGRSPMQQLTKLRVQHAAHLLATTNSKLETIADAAGYRNPFAFSDAFKRVTGVRPSQFRSRRRASL